MERSHIISLLIEFKKEGPRERRDIMLVKVFIQRKIIPGHEEDFKRLLRELFIKAIHAEGFISGETMQSTEEPTIHLTIGTWQSLAQWNSWINSPGRKEANEMFDNILSEPAKMASFHYE